MTQKRQYIDKNGNQWEWDENPETLKAIQRLHDTYRLTQHQTPLESPVTPENT